VYKGTADPGTKAYAEPAPEAVARAMTEDLSDRGWLKAKTVILTGAEAIRRRTGSFPWKDVFAGIPPRAVVEIPYFKEEKPAQRVTITVFDMTRPFRAFAAFSRRRRLPMKEYYFGERELVLTEDTAFFWEGPFCISVKAAGMGEDTKDVLCGVAKGVAYKLYGLVGTYRDPAMAEWFPAAGRKPHTVSVLPADPFGVPSGPAVCMEALYAEKTGERVLYLFFDPSPGKIEEYRVRLVKKLLGKGGVILRSLREKNGEAAIWLTSPRYGIVEAAMRGRVLAVETGLGSHRPLAPLPGAVEVALSGAVHDITVPGVTFQEFPPLLLIRPARDKEPFVVIPGRTREAVRNAAAEASPPRS